MTRLNTEIEKSHLQFSTSGTYIRYSQTSLKNITSFITVSSLNLFQEMAELCEDGNQMELKVDLLNRCSKLHFLFRPNRALR